MRREAVAAVVGGAGLVAWSFTGRRHPLVQAVLAAGLVALARPPLGLRPPALWRGLRTGLRTASAIVCVVAMATAVPWVRAAMAGRDLPDSAAEWLAVAIPLGTVWSEEAAYRAALGTAAADAFGPGAGRLLQATAFGVSHIYDARETGQPVVGTVLATGVAGWLFGWLLERSGSLAAPMLAHLAINEAGAVAALAINRRC
ncbi:MAG: CPBP family intramembrane metalloprotease [Mycobacteriaceae bacterium]|nr:CPBP family intramembrane metalloprotease [Mycobacteriaceae bacterium]